MLFYSYFVTCCSQGALGLNSTTDYFYSFTRIPSSLFSYRRFIDIAAGGSFSLALDDTNQVWSFGFNWNGALGLNTTATISQRAPARIPSTLFNNKKIVKIFAQFFTSFAIADDGTVFSWGINSFMVRTWQ